MFLQEPIVSGGSGERTRFLERPPRTLKALEGRVLVQASSSQLPPMFIMSNQQRTGYSWSSPAGNPLTFGVPSSAPVGCLANTAFRAADGPARARAQATAVIFANAPIAPASALTGGSTTSPYIAPPGTAYTPPGVGAPATAASFANAPVAPVPVPKGGFDTTNPYIASPGVAYAPPGHLNHAPSPEAPANASPFANAP